MNADHQYQCTKCESHHEKWEWARDCCPTDITDIYICAACKQWHFDEADAEACCTEQPDQPAD